MSVKSITINGEQYRLTPGVLREHAEKEQHILSLSKPLNGIEALPPNLQQAMIDAAVTKVPFVVSRVEEAEFDQSTYGVGYLLWRALRDNHHQFGKLRDGESVAYTSPSGTGYSMTPADGVQKTLDWLDDVNGKDVTRMLSIINGDDSAAADDPVEDAQEPAESLVQATT